jgi:hypothetical protein
VKSPGCGGSHSRRPPKNEDRSGRTSGVLTKGITRLRQCGPPGLGWGAARAGPGDCIVAGVVLNQREPLSDRPPLSHTTVSRSGQHRMAGRGPRRSTEAARANCLGAPPRSTGESVERLPSRGCASPSSTPSDRHLTADLVGRPSNGTQSHPGRPLLTFTARSRRGSPGTGPSGYVLLRQSAMTRPLG